MDDSENQVADTNTSVGNTSDDANKSMTTPGDDHDETTSKSDRRSSGLIRKRSMIAAKNYSGEDQALDKISRKAEEELVAKRAARAEARSIRMQELVKHTQEVDEDSEKMTDSNVTDNDKARDAWRTAVAAVNTSLVKADQSSLSSMDSDDSKSSRSKEKIIALEENFKKAMLSNSQLVNEKTKLLFEVDVLKDKIDDLEVDWSDAKYHLKKKTFDLERQLKLNKKLEYRVEMLAKELEKYVVINEAGEVEERIVSEKQEETPPPNDELLTFTEEEREDLLHEISRLKNELHESKMKISGMENQSFDVKVEIDNIKREFGKQVNELKTKVQKLEQENTRLETSNSRLENQAVRSADQIKEFENTNNELKSEKRRLQREVRQLTEELDEVKSENSRLNRRLDKVKGKTHLVSTIN
ncbi:Leucine-rich repeat flightless-interacting protein 2 [Trichoplax sp. H2]|nr:Leucine-rich repeat flightless-interacting protein 2 [Trichoplax sp. H2]|eukprot:RDD42591.1 Leucine-rich repeat flightless-interacting protein 2 [Trichoplax sp. H2]